MKQVKKAYKGCKAKLPNRPPDEIDFGLGFRAGLEMIIEEVTLSPIGLETIQKELGNEKNSSIKR